MTPQRIGPYPIEREVGRGGMGVVYLGRDTRLDRPVAIKVLPDAFARDPERLARFEREARLLAALTHPHIAGIYGLEEADGRRFLTLEYVEGETLAERLQRGALPLEEALEVARQIAGALEAAHEAGIVHRDLKPGNIKLTPAGEVKVLDFGLAKSAAAGTDASADLSQSPTLTYAATGAGVILGTAAYMSPEQARGRPVDRRTDIWSFGCVLYECLTGVQAFAGETVSDTIALILQGSADPAKLLPGTPEKLRLLIARCLERDPRGRLRDIGDARIEIEELLGSRVTHASRLAAAAPAAPAAGAPAWRRGRAMAVAALLLLAGATAGALGGRAFVPRPAPMPMRFTVQPPAGVHLVVEPNDHAISPDGRTLAFVATDSTGQRRLWVRPLAEFEARELSGTRDATLPFWSPDSRQLGFFAQGRLKRVRVAGGHPEPICDAPDGRGAAWGPGDVIVFAPTAGGPLMRVRASGGTPEAVTTLDSTRGESGHRWPRFLPGGEHFTYAAVPIREGQFDCYVGSLRSTERTALLSANGAPVYAAPGHLIFWRSEALLAQRFDTRKRQVVGDAFKVADGPAPTSYSGSPVVSVSQNGVMAWLSAGGLATRLAWLDRGGREIAGVELAPDHWEFVVLSNDGRRAALFKGRTSGAREMWIADLARGVAGRLTSGRGAENYGVWSPDGREVAYSSSRRGTREIYRRAADGSGPDRLIYSSAAPFKDPSDWSPDGRWVMIGELTSDNGWDLILVPAEGGPARPYLAGASHERGGVISPDGKWLLYICDETGSEQAFVQTFPEPGRKQQVSRTGAVGALWASGGREIVLARADNSMVSVSVTPGPELTFGAPRELFRAPFSTRTWWVTADGQRFLVPLPVEQTTPGISIAADWRAGREP